MSKILKEGPDWKPPQWVRIVPCRVYFRAEAMTPEECKQWVLDTMRGCMTGEREAGSDADILLTEFNTATQAIHDRTRRAGLASAAARAGNTGSTSVQHRFNTGSTSVQQVPNTEKEKKEKRDTNRRETEGGGGECPAPPVSVSVEKSSGTFSASRIGDVLATASAPPPPGAVGKAPATDKLAPYLENPKAGIRAIQDGELVPFMVRYCREGDPPFAAHGYKIKIGELGADTFREEAATFIGAVESGEEPRNRGKAFMARLNAVT